MNDPNSTVITQSTMISYDGSGQPRVVQSSTRKAGDVKETRQFVFYFKIYLLFQFISF